MAALVAPGICRYALHGTYAGRPVVNIIDMKIDTTGTTVSRDDSIFEIAGDILNNWFDEIVNFIICEDFTFTKVTWLDLNSLDGAVGERSSTSVHTLPLNGALTNPPMPGNVALRVNKNTIGRRGERQGRMYLCGIAEDLTASGGPNMVQPGDIPAINAGLATFLDNITDESVVGQTDTKKMHVVHTKDGVFTSSSTVTALVVDPMVASQRRRLRG